MSKENHFKFAASQYFDGVTALEANMSDFSYDKHAHEEYSIGVTLQGSQDFFSCRAFHRSSPGCVVLFNPDDVHDGHSGGRTELKYRMLYLHPEQLQDSFLSLGVKAGYSPRVEGTVLNDQQLREQVLSLSYLIDCGTSSGMEQESVVYQVAQSIVRISGNLTEEYAKARVDRLLSRAKEYIYANLHRDISIDDIAAEANMSKYHFIRLFRSQFGITPHQFVLNCRIINARKALESGIASVEVAQMCGFSDSSHLNRRFKRHFGTTPKQYQRQLSR